jgi:hypothetical protein
MGELAGDEVLAVLAHAFAGREQSTSPTDSARCFDAAEAAGRVVAEGFMWRHHPRPPWPAGWWPRGDRAAVDHPGSATVDVPPADIRRSPTLGGGQVPHSGIISIGIGEDHPGQEPSPLRTRTARGRL